MTEEQAETRPRPAAATTFNASLNGPQLRSASARARVVKSNLGCGNLCFRISGLSRCWCSCSACEAKTFLNGRWISWNICRHDPEARANQHVRQLA